MSTLVDSGFPTLANIAARLNPDGSGVTQVANVLSKLQPILRDIPWMEGNLMTGHRITQAVNALPSASWRKFNQGIDPSKGETAQYDETCGLLEDESKLDEAIAELNGGAAYRMTEDALKVEGFGQQFATSVFYESVATNPERIHGLAPRYPATTGYTNSGYVMAGTNAGSNAQSIWLVTWEPRKIYGIYPKGTRAGLEREDKGKERVYDSNNKAFYSWVTRFKWRCGIAVEDYRYAVRFQWDPDDSAYDDGEKSLYLKMQAMITKLFKKTPNTRFYMSRTSKMKLDAQLASNSVNFLRDMNLGGEMLESFQGVPIRVDDTLVAETAIS